MENNQDTPETSQDAPEPTYEELLAKITHPKQRAFLEAFPKFKVTALTTKAIGVHEFTPYDWLTGSEPYRLAFLALKKKIDADRLELYEAELEKRALGGVSKQSDILLMFGIKAENPSKYREAVQAIPFTGTIRVELSVPRAGQPLPEAQKQLKESNATKGTSQD